MLFRSKPQEIEAVQFLGDPEVFVQARITYAKRDNGEYAIWNGLHQSWITCNVGSWVRIDQEGDHCPIGRVYMDVHYEPIIGGTYEVS